MLENAILCEFPHEESKELTKELSHELSALQQKIREHNLPVIIVFEGWGASGKGSMISELIKPLDPRFFNVYSTLPANESERRYPFMKRYWGKTPPYGKMAILDRSWYREIGIDCLEDKSDSTDRTDSINIFERQLNDDGCLIIKFFLQISKKEQRRRFEKLEKSASTRWRVNDTDRARNKKYEKYYEQFDKMLRATNTSYAPWHVVDASDKASAKYCMFDIIVNSIKKALVEPLPKIGGSIDADRLVTMPRLALVKLDNKALTPEEYEEKLEKLSKKLSKLHGKIYKAKIPVVIAFEGWDAAGKGGAINRIGAALDPRGYEAVPIAAPDKTELSHHYLWRFWNHIPKTGHITIFDRTWYGRVMVERIEEFTPEERWSMAYNEINEFESELMSDNTVILKFWLQIDKDEQLKRFEERQNTPEKQWKITDEDWRNREKWDAYEAAVDEMLHKTSTDYAPWHIIEANNKLYARVKIMEIIAARLEKALKE